ncbi:hypothetical protein DLD82_17685 [Methanospirillum stamsii]|uniref:Uncharacterized protein n=1 Tax=Methanospirillum stamsii TaxID=1277351 RepID=A0A2V2MTA3_9EURY|nr:hypothetical protein DLD82_17685 [Methanospirillum stamsii]
MRRTKVRYRQVGGRGINRLNQADEKGIFMKQNKFRMKVDNCTDFFSRNIVGYYISLNGLKSNFLPGNFVRKTQENTCPEAL